jgi:hypothetical protein
MELISVITELFLVIGTVRHRSATVVPVHFRCAPALVDHKGRR